MKYLIMVLALIFSSKLIASEVKYIKSDKLKIISNWLEPDEIPTSDIYRHNLIVLFDIVNVQTILIKDLNIKNGKCEDWIVASSEIFFLSLPNANDNQKKINIRVNRPCSIDQKVRLELLVKTQNKKVYSNIIILKADYNNQIRREYY